MRERPGWTLTDHADRLDQRNYDRRLDSGVELELDTLQLIGEFETRRGSHDGAADHLRHAISLYRQIGDRTGEAAAMDGSGVLHTRLGEPAEAAAVELGDRYEQARAHAGLGHAYRAVAITSKP
jgi:hypothetical protein